ncbi:MAG: hypothetical protein ACFB10_23830 [Salibacteraceae bacterium]
MRLPQLPPFTLVLLAFLLTSCDPEGIWIFGVSNESENELLVQYQISGDSANSELLIAPGVCVQLHEYAGIGGLESKDDEEVPRVFETMQVMRSDSTAGLNFNALDGSRWDFHNVKTGRFVLVPVGENVYTLRVGENELEN